MFNFFKKNNEEISRVNPGYEEVERKTPWSGRILLLIMFVAGLFFGFYALIDISDIPNKPEPLSSCSYKYNDSRFKGGYNSSAYYDYGYGVSETERCLGKLSALEKEYGVSDLLNQKIALEKSRKPINDELKKVSTSLNSVRTQINTENKNYNMSLQEEQAQINNRVFSVPFSQQRITQLRTQETSLIQQQNELNNRLKAIDDQIKSADEKLAIAYKPVFERYETQQKVYEFKVFLIQFLFVLPVFLLVFRKYLVLHRKNSPYTIIFTAILAVVSILLLWTILYWFWGLFLAEILEVLLRLFAELQFLKSLVIYFGMFLSFAIFGGAVYFLQKKIFNPFRVALRRLRAKQCPYCQVSLDLSNLFCPNCSSSIREKCQVCGQARFVDLPTCPHCGNKKIKQL